MNKDKQISTLADSVTGLTPLQEQTALRLAAGESIKAVAEALDIDRGTIYLWQSQTAFRCFYSKQCYEVRESLKNGLLSLRDEALNVIKGALLSENEHTALKTAMWIVDKGLAEEKDKQPTDVRDVLKVEYTRKNSVGGNDVYFHKQEYLQELDRRGLLPDL